MLVNIGNGAQFEVFSDFFKRGGNLMFFIVQSNEIKNLFLTFCKHASIIQKIPKINRKLSTG